MPFKKHSEMVADSDFIQFLEQLISGTVDVAGTNRPLGRLSRNDDALLDAVQSLKVGSMTTGGGTMTWNGSQLAWSSAIIIPMLNEIGGSSNNLINAGSVTLADGGVAYVLLNRTVNGSVLSVSVATSLAAFLSAQLTTTNRLEYLVIARREGTSVQLWDGRRIRTGQSLTNGGYTDTQYGQQTELTLVHNNTTENFRLFLTAGGTLTWDAGTTTFTWSAPLHIEFPGSVGDNFVPAGSVAIASGRVAYLTLTRDPGVSVSKSLTVSTNASVPDGDDIFVLAKHSSVDNRLYLWDGTSLSDGDSVLLGGLQSGVQFFYRNPGTGLQVTDLTVAGAFPSRQYVVGSGSLMVYKNGVKAKASTANWAGAYPTGALVGTLDTFDEYVEEDSGDGTGSRIIWIADGQAVAEPVFHAAATHNPPYTWPTTTDHLEAFVGLQGEGPSPVESVGKYGEVDTLEGAVKLEEGNNITITRDVAHNSLVISASITAGVTSLDGLTGIIDLVPGSKMSIVSGGGLVTISFVGPIAFTDITGVSIDEANAFNGMVTPSATNVVSTLSDHVAVEGFDKVWLDNGIPPKIRTSSGVLRHGSTVYRVDTSELTCTESNLFGSEVLTSSTWYAIYVGPGVTNGGSPSLVISSLFPAKATRYGRHPSNPAYAYIGCVYVSAGAFSRFSKAGGWTYLEDPWSLTSRFSAFPAAGGVTVDLMDAAGMNLKTKCSPTAVKMRMLLNGPTSGLGIVPYYTRVWTGLPSTLGNVHYAVYAAKPPYGIGVGTNWLAAYDIEVPVDPVLGAGFRIDPSEGFTSIDSISVYAFYDGIYTVGTLGS